MFSIMLRQSTSSELIAATVEAFRQASPSPDNVPGLGDVCPGVSAHGAFGATALTKSGAAMGSRASSPTARNCSSNLSRRSHRGLSCSVGLVAVQYKSGSACTRDGASEMLLARK